VLMTTLTLEEVATLNGVLGLRGREEGGTCAINNYILLSLEGLAMSRW
jgi:hypothetical protein